MAFRLEGVAKLRIREIYRSTRDRWGEAQAERYARGLHEAMSRIGERPGRSRVLPAAFGLTGYVLRYEHHFIYWRDLPGGDIGIVAVLHESMHQIARFRDDLPR